MAAMILFIFIGNAAVDGIGPIFHLTFRESLMMAAFVIVFGGLGLAWKWECLGGWMTVGGMLAFYLSDYIFSGDFPQRAGVPDYCFSGDPVPDPDLYS
jgi:hypothetical protein